FYIEELLNYLHEQGLDLQDPAALTHFDLPTSLHSLILSRIDQLSEPQKVTIKVASIIGRLFRFAWLQGYYPSLGEPDEIKAHLEVLRRLDLTPLEHPEPELTYLFKHIVTQEVAYESLTYATRAALHEQLARFIEGLSDTASTSYLDLLAYHYERSENPAKKCHYLRRAGEAAQAAYANSAAQAYYTRLLPLLQGSGERLEVHLRLGSVLELVGEWESAEAHYQAALGLGRAADQPRAQAQSTLALGKLCRLRGQYEAAQEWLHQALAQWEAAGEAGGLSQTLAEVGWVALSQGDYDHAGASLEQSRALCQRHGDQVGLAFALNGLGIVALVQGRYDIAQALLEQNLALRREIGGKAGIASSLINLSLVALEQKNHDVAQTLLEESLMLTREMGDKRGLTLVLSNLGHVAYGQANETAAQQHYRAALRLAQEIGDKGSVVDTLVGLVALMGHEGTVQHLRRAACLLGATEALRAALGKKLEPIEQGLYDEAHAITHAQLSEEELAVAWVEGQAMTLDEAVAFALNDLKTL
ncbi:MAG: tetratricopeptide repeat protein, partial [Ardenticatenales bacterium]|nr:tetratricopeptide repeat protein [Ardenticatenales bacterium]